MWVPLVIGGITAIWFLGKKPDNYQTLNKSSQSDDLNDYLVSKVEKPDNLPVIPNSVVRKNINSIKNLKVFTPTDVWG